MNVSHDEDERAAWNILIIDDDEDDFFLARNMLREARGQKFTVQWASSYEKGRSELFSNHYHAVLVDYDLGVHSGIALIREANERGYPAPLILFTGRGNYEVDVEAMQAGATMYLTKGEVGPLLLERSIRYAIERKQTEQALRLSEERFTKAFNANPNAMLITRIEDGQIEAANNSFAHLFGYSQEELRGKTARDLDLYTGGLDRDEVIEEIKTRGFVRDLALDLYTKSRDKRAVNISIEMMNIDGKTAFLSIFQDVTTQKKLLEENYKQKDLLERLVQTAPAGIAFVYGPQHIYTLVNAAYERLARGKGQLIGRSVADVWPEAADVVLPQLDRVYQTGVPVSMTDAPLTIVRDGIAEGNYFTYTFTPIYQSDGSIEGVMILGMETTAAVRDRQAVEAQSARFEAILQALPVGVWITDADGRIIGKNAQADRIWAGDVPMVAETEQYQEYQSWDAQTGKKLKLEEYPLVIVLRTKQRVDPVEHRILRFDGSEGYVLVSAMPILDGAGQLIGAVAINLDITERKQAEEELRASEEILQLALTAGNAGVWSWDLIKNTVHWSDEYCRIFGFEPGSVEPSTKAGFSRVHPEDREHIEKAIQEAITQNKKIDVFHRVIWPDDSIHWVRGLSQAFYNSNGQPYRIAGIALDVTHQKHEEETLAKYAERLARSNQDLQNFAFIASHDLQEPLRKIIRFGELLQQSLGCELDGKSTEFLERMQNAAKRMQEMVDDLLDLSRINTHGRPFESVDLNQTAAEVISDLEALIERTGGKVQVDSLPTIEADPVQMRQLLQNFVGNALKFHKPEVPPIVRVTATKAASHHRPPQLVTLLVADNGIGFDMQHFDRILEPFQRLKGRSEFEGTGIGLAICKRIIDRHHGQLQAQSQPGKGATFMITLPIRQSA